MKQMIIANRLIDGAVVFLAPNYDWVTAIGEGLLLEGDADTEQAMAVAKQHELECAVVEPTAIEVAIQEGKLRPTAIREAIRAFGPTVRTDLETSSSAENDAGAEAAGI